MLICVSLFVYSWQVSFADGQIYRVVSGGFRLNEIKYGQKTKMASSLPEASKKP